MKEPIRFAVVGARGYARTLLRCIERLEEEGRGRLVASMLRNRAAYPEIAAAMEARGVRVYDDYEAMLDACQGEVDVVVLPTAIHYHAPMAIAALQAGYHVFLEKPVAGSLAEVDQIICGAGRERAAVRGGVPDPLLARDPDAQALHRGGQAGSSAVDAHPGPLAAPAGLLCAEQLGGSSCTLKAARCSTRPSTMRWRTRL